MEHRTLHGALTFLGFIVSLMAVFYFATEYLPQVSEWTRLAALILMGLSFAYLGVYLRQTTVGQPFFATPGLGWLRPTNVLYLAALLCGIVAEAVFLGLDDVAKPLKILVSLLVGVGLIVGVALRTRRQADPTQPGGPAP